MLAASDPLRINFDAQIFCAQAHGGISRYIVGLARALDRCPNVAPLILAPRHCNSHLESVEPHLVRGRRAADAPSAAGRLSSLLGSALMQLTRPAQILHLTYYYPFTHLPSRSRTILTVHDMIHEKFPQSFGPRDPIARWKRRAVQRADVLLCVSENTRRDLLEHYGDIASERVFVAHLGVDPLQPPGRPSTPEVSTALPDWPYILFVGSRTGYKNFGTLLQAYRSSTWLQQHVGLVCFGGGPFTPHEQDAIRQCRTPSRVRQLGGSDALLAQCYAQAAVFVYPSLYEGFGIPPLEAMGLGCPVACSRTSSIPEVVGDAGHYFDPHEVDAVRDALETVLASDTLRETLVLRGRQRHAQFSWDRCAQRTLSAYRASLQR